MNMKSRIGFTYYFQKILEGKIIKEWKSKNIMLNEGLNYVLAAAFNGSAAISSWFIVLYLNNHTPNPANTYASPGFSEATTQIIESARQGWAGSISGLTMSSSQNKAVYTFNTACTVYGAALVGGGISPSVKGDTSGGGKLISAALAESPEEMIAEEKLSVWAELTIAGA